MLSKQELLAKSNVALGIAGLVVTAAAIVLLVVIPIPSKTDGQYVSPNTHVGEPPTCHNAHGKAYCSEGSLRFRDRTFFLGSRPFRIISGAMHYFRVHPDHWRDRLMKLKACGMNTLETLHGFIYPIQYEVQFLNDILPIIESGIRGRIRMIPDRYSKANLECYLEKDGEIKNEGEYERYVPWNLHEEYPGEFSFEGILDLRQYIKLAQEVGLYVILRPGPYICSEWDYGGLPAWLLHDPNMKVRSQYQGYKDALERYFNKLIPLVTDLQFSNGGPIIAFQVENEFGSYSNETDHLIFIRELLLRHGVNQLLLTSDNDSGIKRDVFYQYALPTANFQHFDQSKDLMATIANWSSDFPLMVMEFWTGWFDHWESGHGGLALADFEKSLKSILEANGSLNFYMFHGGTNFGFTAGANTFVNKPYEPDVTSYDYDALLSEAGDITPKYHKARELLLKYVLSEEEAQSLPAIPKNTEKGNYGSVNVSGYLDIEDILGLVENPVTMEIPVAMEMLHIHKGYGQNFGYVMYRCNQTIHTGNHTLTFTSKPVDRAQVFINGKLVSTLDWKNSNLSVTLTEASLNQQENRLDILVENHGRVNYVQAEYNYFNEERKGVNGDVHLNGNPLKNWTIFPLEMKQNLLQRAVETKTWKSNKPKADSPMLCIASLHLSNTERPKDTFIKLPGWSKGTVYVNNFNLGRYWAIGPQQTLHVPGPILKQGNNTILVFEQHKVGEEIVFQDTPILG